MFVLYYYQTHSLFSFYKNKEECGVFEISPDFAYIPFFSHTYKHNTFTI